MAWDTYDAHCNGTCQPDCEFCQETKEEEMEATEDQVRAALVAALRDRLDVCGAYVGLETPQSYLERLALLRHGADYPSGRPTEELKRLHRSAGALLELLAHCAVPEARLAS